jgi:hypothetical protein
LEQQWLDNKNKKLSMKKGPSGPFFSFPISPDAQPSWDMAMGRHL